MTPRVHNMRAGTAPVDAIYCGRPSPFGNPFRVGLKVPAAERGPGSMVGLSRGESIKRYRRWLALPAQDALRARIRRELKGRDLVCWCAPEPCHCDVLLEVANDG